MEHSEGEPWQDTGAAGHCESAANLPPPSARNACTGMDAVMNLNLSFVGTAGGSEGARMRRGARGSMPNGAPGWTCVEHV